MTKVCIFVYFLSVVSFRQICSFFSVVIEPKGAGAEGDGDGMPRTLTFSTGVCRVRLVVETVISQYKYASS